MGRQRAGAGEGGGWRGTIDRIGSVLQGAKNEGIDQGFRIGPCSLGLFLVPVRFDSHLAVAEGGKFHQLLLPTFLGARETKLLNSANFKLRSSLAFVPKLLELECSAQIRVWS